MFWSNRPWRPEAVNDLLIAAHALALGYVLVTENEREFARVEGLRLQNWLRSRFFHQTALDGISLKTPARCPIRVEPAIAFAPAQGSAEFAQVVYDR